MSLVAALSARLATTLSHTARLAVNRLGLTPALLLAFATAALLLSLRHRPRHRNPRQPPPQPQQQQIAADVDADAAAQRAASGRRRRRSSSQQVPDDGGVSAVANEAQTVLATTTADGASTVVARDAVDGNLQAGVRRITPLTVRKPQWLSRVRRVSIGTTCTSTTASQLFTLVQGPPSSSKNQAPTSPSPQPQTTTDDTPTMTPTVTLSSDAVGSLSAFATLFDLYLVVRVDNDATETAVTAALSAAGLFDPGFLDRRKLVFTETDEGRVSVARQIEPHLHVDESLDVTVALQRFLPSVALVSPTSRTVSSDLLGRNVAKLSSFTAFFS